MIDLRVLGAVEVHANLPDVPEGVVTQPKRLALLLYLALAEPTGLHSRERLTALLWPEADNASARHSLRNALHGLRQSLGDDAITTRGEAYVGLEFGAFKCDALELRAHLDAGRVDEAVALWTGDLAPGFHVSGAPDFERWLDAQREGLRRAVRSAAWKRARELEGTGEPEVNAVRRAARLDPEDEPGARWLMRLLANRGDRGAALRVYQELEEHFARELETEPSAETQALAAELRAADAFVRVPAKQRVTAPALPQVSPAINESAPVTARPRLKRRWVALAAIAAGVIVVLSLSNPYRSRRESSAQAEAEQAVLRLPKKYRADTAAYFSYMRGLTLRFKLRFIECRDTLQALVDRDPGYAPGWYGLAHAYIFTALYGLADPDETWRKVDQASRTAIALDSAAASPWLALAGVDMWSRLDLTRARERIARAQALDSLDPEVPGVRSVWFRFYGQMDSAIANSRLAHSMYPLSRLSYRQIGVQLYLARRYEESRQVYADLMRTDPGWIEAYREFAEVNRAMGRPRDAVEWFRRARDATGDAVGAAALRTVATDSEAIRQLATDARRTIAQLDSATRAGERVPARRYALARAALRDTVETLRWLDSMLVRHDGFWSHQVRLDPLFDFLRRDARYRSWEARSGLPPLIPSADCRLTNAC